MPRKRSLPVRVVLRLFYFAQNRLRPTPTIAHSKITPRSTPFGRSEASADCSVYGSPHGYRRR